LPSTTFCWLPPDNVPTATSPLLTAMASSAMLRWHSAAS
jgi:hypothetical protein